MARRRRRRRKKSNLNIIIMAAILLLAVIIICVNIFNSKDSIVKIKEILNINTIKTVCNVSKVSSIDTKVYSENGIKYTNRHENKVMIENYDSGNKDELGKILAVRTILNNLEKLEKGQIVKSLPNKDDGYYWIQISMTTEEKQFFTKKQNTSVIDLYYDISEGILYTKEKYYDEFSKKNDNVKLKGYVADDKYKKLIDELAMTKTE